MSTAAPPPKIACPHCQGQIKAPALPPGSLVNCPKCGKGFALGGEGSGQKVEGSKQRTGVRSQESGDSGQGRGERGQGAEDRGQGTGDRKEVGFLGSASLPSKPTLPRAHSGTRGVVTPPDGTVHQSAEALPVGNLVPIDATTAAAATEPAHQSPGKHAPARPDTIDPLMLGPQPLPKPKVKKDEVAVVCYLCKTRMYAPIAQIGQTIKCPDCHTVNEVKAPPAPPEKKKTGPTLDDAPDFGLNDPGERPAYRPIVDPRGEYAVLAEFDPAQRPAGWSRPGSAAPAVAAADDDDDDDHVEITIAAPVERIELKPEIKPLPPPDPDDDLYDGKFDDGLIGDRVDRSQPNAWKKAPLVIGILGFLFYTSTLPRLVLYIIGLILAITISHLAINFGSSEDASEKVGAIFFSGLSVVSLGFWVTSFAAVCLSIVQDTANGQDDVTSYPDWNIVDWIATSFYFPAAAFVAGLPGSILTVSMISVGLDPTYGAFAAGAPLVLSWIALFPMVLYSMLAEGSVLAPYSPATYKSMQQASEGWVFFYMYAILLGIAGSISLALAGWHGDARNLFIPWCFGCIGLVVTGVLYCRVLGRLMWYSSEKMARQERLEERRRAAAGA